MLSKQQACNSKPKAGYNPGQQKWRTPNLNISKNYARILVTECIDILFDLKQKTA
jgi:hypothetical protein